jgi:hypothetical protein
LGIMNANCSWESNDNCDHFCLIVCPTMEYILVRTWRLYYSFWPMIIIFLNFYTFSCVILSFLFFGERCLVAFLYPKYVQSIILFYVKIK